MPVCARCAPGIAGDTAGTTSLYWLLRQPRRLVNPLVTGPDCHPLQELSPAVLPRVSRRPRLLPPLIGACLALLLGVLTGCATAPAAAPAAAADRAEQAQPSEGEAELARSRILRGLNEGLSAYRLVPGDALEILFLTGHVVESAPYRVNVGDRLRIEFHFVDEAARTVLVRPDGMVTLPYKGDVAAAERTPGQLAADLQRLYADIWREPRITVTVEQFTSKLDDLRLTLSSSQRGRSQRVVLSSDGQAYLPYLPGLRLAGLTVDQARERINAEYRQRLGGLEVSVLLDAVAGNRVFVFGEVPRPGLVAGGANMTVLQAVASAGGVLPTGAADTVRVLSWSEQAGGPQLRTVDLQRIATEGRIQDDLLLAGQSTVYVPPTGLVKAGRVVDQFLRQLLLFNGVSLGFNYELNR